MQQSAAISIALRAICSASRSGTSINALAAASAKFPPEPMAMMLSCGSSTSPLPETCSEISLSATTITACADPGLNVRSGDGSRGCQGLPIILIRPHPLSQDPSGQRQGGNKRGQSKPELVFPALLTLGFAKSRRKLPPLSLSLPPVPKSCPSILWRISLALHPRHCGRRDRGTDIEPPQELVAAPSLGKVHRSPLQLPWVFFQARLQTFKQRDGICGCSWWNGHLSGLSLTRQPSRYIMFCLHSYTLLSSLSLARRTAVSCSQDRE